MLFSISGRYQKDDLENKVEKNQSMYLEYKKDFPEVLDIQVKDLNKPYVFIDIKRPRPDHFLHGRLSLRHLCPRTDGRGIQGPKLSRRSPYVGPLWKRVYRFQGKTDQTSPRVWKRVGSAA